MSDVHVAITGPFADVNFGDYGMLVNNLYDLRPKKATLFSYDSGFLESIKEDYLSEFEIRVVEVNLKSNIDILMKTGYTPTPLEILDLVENYTDVEDAIKPVDFLMVNGGGYLNSLWAMPHRIERLVKILVPVLVANRLGKKILFTGNSYGPFGAYEDFYFGFFNSLENVTYGVRDNLYSPASLKRLGIASDQILHLPDDLYILNSEIAAKSLTPNWGEGDYLVLETYLTVDYLREFRADLIEFAERMKAEHQLDIVFLPFHLETGGVHQAEYLQSILPNFRYFDIRGRGYLPLEDAAAIVKNAKLVVSTRYHALVIALSARTPVVNVLKDVVGDKQYYYNKSMGMLKRALGSANFDERKFLQLDFVGALRFIADNLDAIVTHQEEAFASHLDVNRDELDIARQELIQRLGAPTQPRPNV